MDVKFDYRYGGKGFFGAVYRPVAKVSFQSPVEDKLWVSTWMVVDTGADFTVLPRYISKDLGVSLETDCVVDTTRGVGGEETVYLMKKKMLARVGELERRVPVAFFAADEIPPLLGRLGFLETFDVEFLKKRRVVFRG